LGAGPTADRHHAIAIRRSERIDSFLADVLATGTGEEVAMDSATPILRRTSHPPFPKWEYLEYAAGKEEVMFRRVLLQFGFGAVSGSRPARRAAIATFRSRPRLGRSAFAVDSA
jgi:hypothetical protein